MPAEATHCLYQGRQGYISFYFCPSHFSSPGNAARPEGLTRFPASTPYADMAHMTAEHYGVDPKLVHAIISVESGWDPRAVSRKGAQGLMQLMPQTAARYGVRDVFDPLENIEGGARYLRDLLHEFNGDLRLALAAYNAGGEAVRHYRGIPPYPETQEYVRAVLAAYRSAPS